MTAASVLGPSDPLGHALGRFAVEEEKVGEAQLHMITSVHNGTLRPLTDRLTTNFKRLTVRFHWMSMGDSSREQILRKEVNAARLRLDTARARAKATVGDRASVAQVEVKTAENEYTLLLDQAMREMQFVLEDVCLCRLCPNH